MKAGMLKVRNLISEFWSYHFIATIKLRSTFSIFVLGLTILLFVSGCKKSAESLIAELKDSNSEEVRGHAAEVLGERGDKRAVEPLIAALNDDSGYVSCKAITALGKIGDTRAVPHLIHVLQDDSDYVRGLAATALGEIGDTRAIEPLVSILRDRSGKVNSRVVKALGKIGDTRAVPHLIHVLQDDSDYVRGLAATALGEIGDPGALQPLIAALKDNDIDVRYSVAAALDKLGWRAGDEKEKVAYLIAKKKWDQCTEIGSPAVEPLIALLNNSDYETYHRAAKTLVSIGNPAVEPLIAVLKGNDHSARLEAVEALGEIGDMRGAKPLVAALTDDSEYIRKGAAKALDRLDWQAGDETEKAAYFVAKENWRKCFKIGSPAVGPLIAIAENENNDIYDRRIAAKLLLRIEDQKGVLTLIPWLKDQDIQETVANALSKLGWQPESIADKVHYAVAMKDKSALIGMWEQTKTVLLDDVLSNEYSTMENALYAFVGIGNEEIMPTLITTLNSKGDKSMAEAFLNCGRRELASAAREWAERHGYTIKTGGGAAPVRWSSW